MENKRFLTAQDVMEMLGVSLSYSYKLIRRLIAELERAKEVAALELLGFNGRGKLVFVVKSCLGL